MSVHALRPLIVSPSWIRCGPGRDTTLVISGRRNEIPSICCAHSSDFFKSEIIGKRVECPDSVALPIASAILVFMDFALITQTGSYR